MTTSIQVLQYIKSVMPHVNNTQAMKLLYYTQAWSLAWSGRKVFSDPVIAWQFGPATLDAYQRFETTEPRSDSIPVGAQLIVKSIVAHYGWMTAGQLRDLSHSESPWIKAYYAPDGGHEARKPISPISMKKEYTMQAMTGRGPQKPRVGAAIVGRSKFESMLNKVRSEDREALDILATR